MPHYEEAGICNLSSGCSADCHRNNHELCSKSSVHKGPDNLAVSACATWGLSPNAGDFSLSCRPCTANCARVYSSAWADRGPL